MQHYLYFERRGRMWLCLLWLTCVWSLSSILSRLARDPPAGREAGRRGSALLHLPAGASAVLFYTCHTVDRLNLSGNSYFALESNQLIDRHSNLTDTVTNHLELISIVGGGKDGRRDTLDSSSSRQRLRKLLWYWGVILVVVASHGSFLSINVLFIRVYLFFQGHYHIGRHT